MTRDDFEYDSDPFASDDIEDPLDDSNWSNEWDDGLGEWPVRRSRRAQPRVNTNTVLYAVIAVVAVVAVGGGGYLAVRQLQLQLRSPVQTTQLFYESLNQKDFEQLAEYVDPANRIEVAILENADNLLEFVFGMIVSETESAFEFDIPIPDFVMELIADIDWEFRELEYVLVSEEADRAVVSVTGEMEIALPGLGFYMPLPWAVQHTLVRIDGKWYVQLDLGL